MDCTRTHRPKQPPAPWTWSTGSRPCPCCQRAGCLVSAPTDPAAVVCRTVTSAEPIGTAGYLHELRQGPTWAPWRRSLPRIAKEAISNA
jgi:hypothetical protein